MLLNLLCMMNNFLICTLFSLLICKIMGMIILSVFYPDWLKFMAFKDGNTKQYMVCVFRL